jgi:hypothetical protein
VADHRDLGRADRHRHQVPSAGLRSNTVELALIDVMIQAPSSNHPRWRHVAAAAERTDCLKGPSWILVDSVPL